MFRWGLLFLIIWLGSSLNAAASGLSQQDWMTQLIDSLGWGYGLPDEPRVEDYIALLSGQRKLRVEAEDNHRRSDRIAIKRLANYGSFSGTGWVSGRSEPVQLHLDILVPHNGRYRLSAATRLPGVTFQVAGQLLTASAGEDFTTQELGPVNLVAGPTEVVVTLPPNGGLDYLELAAAPLPAIAPLQGWKPERSLTTADLAITVLQALDLLSVLPATDQVFRFEAETAGPQKGLQVIRHRYLGVPSGSGWIRVGHQQATWKLPFSLSQSGCYQLQIRGISDKPVKVVLDGLFEAQVNFGQALTSYPLGSYCLPKGNLTLVFDLPPWAGIDSLEIRALDISEQSVTRLLGLPAGQTGVDRQTVNDLLQLLSQLTH